MAQSVAQKAAFQKMLAAKKTSPKTFKGKPMTLGGGGKFAKGVSGMTAKGMPAPEAAAIMANAGAKKYGQAKMTVLAAKGKAKAAKKGGK
jgi:hypothetical protein